MQSSPNPIAMQQNVLPESRLADSTGSSVLRINSMCPLCFEENTARVLGSPRS